MLRSDGGGFLEEHRVASELGQLALFQGFSAREIEGMLTRLRFIIKGYKRGGVVMSRGDECPFLMILLEGTLSGEFVNEDGKVVEVDRIEAPGEVAPGIIFASDPRLPVDLVTIEDVRIMFVQKDELLRLLVSDHRLVLNFLRIVSDKLMKITSRFYNVSMKELEEKVMAYLLEIRERLGASKFELPHTKEELAKRFGVTRPSVSRAFSMLAKRGMIEQRGKIITVNYLRLKS